MTILVGLFKLVNIILLNLNNNNFLKSNIKIINRNSDRQLRYLTYFYLHVNNLLQNQMHTVCKNHHQFSVFAGT